MTTKIIEIGDAIYLDESSIQVSKPDDWGWFTSEFNSLLVVQLVKVRQTLLLGLTNPFSEGDWEITVAYKGDDLEVESIEIDEKSITDIGGLPYEFSANIRTNNGNKKCSFVQEQRISLAHYNKILKNENLLVDEHILIPDSGYYPSCFFFMLGATSNGKTCWLHALNTDNVRNKAIEHFSGRWTINYSRNESETSKPLSATKIEDFNEKAFYSFELNDAKGEKNIHVFVVDVAGEINRREQRKKNAVRNILLTISPYAAGIFVVRNKDWLFRENQEQKQEEEFDPSTTIQKLMKGNNALTEDKICYILTGADKIKKDIERDFKKGEEHNLAPNSPIFCHTEIDLNRAIASDIMKRRDRRIKNSPCFAVSCCCDTEDEDTKKEKLNFLKAYNVELPLIYMLKSLLEIS